MRTYFLHGFGSSAETFAAVWRRADAVAPNSVFLEGFEADPLTGARRWFALTGREERQASAVAECARRVEQRILEDSQTEPVALAGHSQGGMIALELARSSLLRISHAAVFAAFLPRPWTRTKANAARSVTIHASNADRYIEIEHVARTAAWLHDAGVSRVACRVTAALPHAFCERWLDPELFNETIHAH